MSFALHWQKCNMLWNHIQWWTWHYKYDIMFINVVLFKHASTVNYFSRDGWYIGHNKLEDGPTVAFTSLCNLISYYSVTTMIKQMHFMNSQLIRRCQQITLTITSNSTEEQIENTTLTQEALPWFILRTIITLKNFAELNLSHVWYGHFREFCWQKHSRNRKLASEPFYVRYEF